MPSTRRQLLTRFGLAGLAGSLGWAGRLPLARALAGPVQHRRGAPLRLILFPVLNGVEDQYFWPTGDTLPMATEPLNSFRDRMTFVRGLDTAGSHDHMAIRSMFTGAPIASYDVPDPGVRSLDQVVAQHVADSEPTAVKSVHVAAVPAGAIEEYKKYGRSTFYFDPEPLDYDANPVTAFDKLFGSLDDLPDDNDEAARLEAAVLALTNAELGELRDELADTARERKKLEIHAKAVQQLADGSGADTPEGCSGEAIASVEKLRAELQGNEAGAYQFGLYSDIFDAQIDVLSRAIVCGLTRVATMQANSADGNVIVPVLGGRPHHDTSHGSQADFAHLVRWYAEKCQRLLTALDVPDPLDPGRTVLDNSCVLWLSECNPNHDSADVPCFYAGSAGGRLVSGGLVDVDGATNRHLLRTLADVFGAPASTSGHFGDDTLAEIKA